ncbi:MAG: GDP-mannose 4,6-dehydratase [Chthoniobacterales bacterium]|nr:GDP-mannose 4,6-dehydratase [Chthoniobacterales bacterium]
MKLLITGGCGFLGSNLAAEALRRGEDLVLFDNLSSRGAINNLQWLRDQGTFSFIHGDIRNAHDVMRVVSNTQPDAIFHLVGQVAMTTSIANPRYDFEVNAMGTINLLEAARFHSPQAQIIYSSTNKVYGDLEEYHYRETATRYECLDFPKGFDEKIPLEFCSPYGCSKGAADQYMLDYARIFELPTVVLRHSSMYGGRQFPSFDQGWVSWFCYQALEQKKQSLVTPFTIAGNGKQVRDLLHGDDIVRLYYAIIDKNELTAGEAFNIGGGHDASLSLLELFALLESITGKKLAYEKLTPRASDQKVFIADCSKVKRLFGWVPQIDSRTGIEQMCDWIQKNLV